MEDKVKHRIVGAVVIAAFLVILVPALIKKVSWHSDTAENKSMIESSMPSISAPQSFQTSEIAQVSLNNNPASQAAPATSLPADTTAVASIPEPIESPAITPEGTTQPATANMAVTPATPAPAATVPAPATMAPAATPATAAAPTTTATVTPAPAPSPLPAAQAPTPVSAPVQAPAPVAVMAPPPAPAPVKAQMVKPVVAVKKTIVVKKTLPHAPVKVVKTVTVKKAVVVKKSPPVLAGTNNYCLQMGAFANQSNANLLIQRLKAHGFSSAHSTTITLPSGITVHKVSLCKRMTPAEAIALRNRLIQLNNTPIIVIKS